MPRGGIRNGAGRPRRRRRIEDCLCLNAHRIQRLSMWVHYLPAWETPTGEVAIDFCRQPQVMSTVRDDHCDQISLEYTHPRYGGERMWFLCPSCSRRCRDVYMPLDCYLWGCRVCLDLSYATENETKFDRLMTKQQKLEMRLARCRPRQTKKKRKLRAAIIDVEMDRDMLIMSIFPEFAHEEKRNQP